MPLSFKLTKAMVNAALDEWLAAHPGKQLHDLDPEEFGDIIMRKIAATAAIVPHEHLRKQ